MHGHADIVAELAAAPAALIDAVDFEKGWTALMYAGRWGMAQIVQLLLDCGADTEVAGNEDQGAERDRVADAERGASAPSQAHQCTACIHALG